MKKILNLVILGCLAGALFTFTLPLVQAKVPPVVTEKWSAWDMTRPLTKMMGKKESKIDMVKVDFDFMDVLVKILPKNEKTGERQKFSLTFVAGLLVPVSMVGAYFFALLALIFSILGVSRLFPAVNLISVVSSVYALVGTYFLGQAAQNAFQSAVDKKAEGLLGVVTKHLVREISIVPDTALFALVGCVVMALLLSYVQKMIVD